MNDGFVSAVACRFRSRHGRFHPLGRGWLVGLQALILLVSGMCGAGESMPDDGLCLRLRYDAGVERSAGRVKAWRDVSPRAVRAYVPADAAAPVTSGEAVVFGHDRVLRIDGALGSPDCRALTVIVVARVDNAGSVTLFGSRDGAVPLVQLDVEDSGQARFIVRDTHSRTLQSLTSAPLGARAVYAGVLEAGAGNACTVRVNVGDAKGEPATGVLASPLLSAVQWIGGLRVGSRSYDVDGAISEVLVYSRALSDAELDAVRDALTSAYAIEPPPPPPPDSYDVLDPTRSWPAPTADVDTDVCVVGAGSGGVGAALAAARRGVRVLVVERQRRLGGTGTNAFVSSWEPGPGCTLAAEIYERMHRIPGGAGVAVSQPKVSDIPMGFYLVTDGVPYSATLRRIGSRGTRANVSYKPEVFDRVVRDMLAETGHATVLDGTTFFRAEVEAGRVTSVLVQDADGTTIRIRARVFIDCTGDVYVCRSAGCETMLGVEPRRRFGESLAPEKPVLQLNAMSRCYTIRPSADPRREPAPEPPVQRFPRCAWITGWRDGIRTINPLPMLPGRALIDLGYDECLRRTERVARAHWRWLQPHPEVAGYELHEIAPMLGIREGYRVVTEYVLRQADLEAGLPNQPHPDIIAVADHPCDTHGAGSVTLHMTTAYGVPYRCLIPAGGWENLLVACRGSGFSHIAASSCRLERTMIQLGHAAGAAAAAAIEAGCAVSDIDVPALVTELDAVSRYPEAVGLDAGSDR